MQFSFNQDGELLTPNIKDAGVNSFNPMLTSSDLFPLDDHDIHFSSISSKENEYQFPSTNDNMIQNSDNTGEQQEYDIFSTFDFPVLSELTTADVSMALADLHPYLTQPSLSCSQTDTSNALVTDESTLPWTGEECTVESAQGSDMTLPPSPSVSSESSFASTSKQRSTRKASLTVIERKLRKKDQNKTAAEKYRKKKQAERVELKDRYTNLKTQNQELKMELEGLSLRLERFKQLFIDYVQLPIPSNQSN